MTKKDKIEPETTKTKTKTKTTNELLIEVVTALKNENESLTDNIIKKAIYPIEGIPRTFPNEWGGKGKKSRPEGKPKGPKNSYIIFSSEKRQEMRDKYPDIPNSAPKGQKSITSMIGELWEKLDDKKVYQDKANKDSERYEKEMEIWEKENPQYARKTNQPKKKTLTNSYRVFCEEKREDLKKNNPTKKINSILSDMWATISEEEREKYKKIANERNADMTVELTDEQKKKANDPNFVKNETGQYVKADGKKGKRILKKKEVEVPTTTNESVVKTKTSKKIST